MIENERCTWFAAAKVTLPACDAVMVQLPWLVKLTIDPVTVQFPEAEYVTASVEELVAVSVKGPGSGWLAIAANVIVCNVLVIENVLVPIASAYVEVAGEVARIEQVPSATAVITPAAIVHAPEGFPVAVIVTVPVEGTVTLTFWVAPITKLGRVEGVNIGELSWSVDGAAIVTDKEASEKALSPTMLEAFTFTVYEPAEILVSSTVLVLVEVGVSTAVPELSYK